MPEALRVLEPSQGSFAVPEPFRQRSQTEREIAVRAQAKSLLPALFARLELASIPVDESECGQRPTVLGHLQSRRAECFEGSFIVTGCKMIEAQGTLSLRQARLEFGRTVDGCSRRRETLGAAVRPDAIELTMALREPGMSHGEAGILASSPG